MPQVHRDNLMHNTWKYIMCRTDQRGREVAHASKCALEKLMFSAMACACSLVVIRQFSLEHPAFHHVEQRLARANHRAVHQASHEGVAMVNVCVQARRQGPTLRR